MRYRIVQILNNNVAIVHTGEGKQNIVMGRGVAFHKHQGDLIQEEKVDKVFEIKDKNTDNYPIAYQISDDVIKGFQSDLNISFPDSEHKSIALHFINAHTTGKVEKEKSQTENNEIIGVVQKELDRNGIYRTQKNANDYDRLLVHLKYFINRINNHKPDSLPISKGMVGEIEANYSKAWKIVQRIKELMQTKLQIELSLSEQTYLTIHIQRLI